MHGIAWSIVGKAWCADDFVQEISSPMHSCFQEPYTGFSPCNRACLSSNRHIRLSYKWRRPEITISLGLALHYLVLSSMHSLYYDAQHHLAQYHAAVSQVHQRSTARDLNLADEIVQDYAAGMTDLSAHLHGPSAHRPGLAASPPGRVANQQIHAGRQIHPYPSHPPDLLFAHTT